MKSQPDRRLHAYRDDLADIALKATVRAERYTTATPARIGRPVVDMKDAPDDRSEAVSQALLGETVAVYEQADGWSWIQVDRDRYVGYVPSAALMPVAEAPTHLVVVPRSFVYARADLRSPVVMAVSMASRLRIVDFEQTRGTAYGVLADGSAVIAAHLRPVTHRFDDFVAIAETFLETPYLWAGKSGFGLDCSGLIQLSMLMCGQSVLRDSDMQAAAIGEPLDPDTAPQAMRRGDLVFWKGHAGIMADDTTLIHASGHSMQVVREPLEQAIDRIARLYARPTAYRRPATGSTG